MSSVSESVKIFNAELIQVISTKSHMAYSKQEKTSRNFSEIMKENANKDFKKFLHKKQPSGDLRLSFFVLNESGTRANYC